MIDGESTQKLKFIYPNTWGAINNVDTIKDEEDWLNLLEELADDRLGEKLIRAHDNSRIIADSKLSLYKICAVRIRVKKQPYQYTDETEE